MFLRSFLVSLTENSYKENKKSILNLLEKNPKAIMLDLGCDDGVWTAEIAKKIGTNKKYGVELVESRADLAEIHGVKVSRVDLNLKLHYKDNFFDVVHANQVIEHLSNTDSFIEEIHRILKPNGYAIISTENLSSWHNIFSLSLGYQPFSMSNYSKKGSIGNPLALWKDKESANSALSSWQHNRLFSFYGLLDLAKKFGFNVEKVLTSGYYPLWGKLSKIDKIHGHWIVVKIKKPMK